MEFYIDEVDRDVLIIRDLLLQKVALCNGGVVFDQAYWKLFLRRARKPVGEVARQEVI